MVGICVVNLGTLTTLMVAANDATKTCDETAALVGFNDDWLVERRDGRSGDIEQPRRGADGRYGGARPVTPATLAVTENA